MKNGKALLLIDAILNLLLGIVLLAYSRPVVDFFGWPAIVINLCGGVVLFFWLVSGKLDLPLHGSVILWILDVILVVISLFELQFFLRKDKL